MNDTKNIRENDSPAANTEHSRLAERPGRRGNRRMTGAIPALRLLDYPGWGEVCWFGK